MMEKLRKNLTLVMLACISMVALTLSSCNDDNNDSPDAPTFTPPAVTNVDASASSDITFAVTVPGGYKSSEVTATGGTATVKSAPAAGAKSGNVVVTFTAGASTGAGAVVLTVTDNNNKKSASTGVINITTPDLINEITSDITTNTSWTKDKKYLLKGNIFVNNGATLTIEAGTVVYGDKVSKGALIIERGSKIIANGTATAPIVFTSNAPAGFRNYGDWGGVVLLGKAQNNQNANQNIEGITASSKGQYGGTTDDDNSGSMKYVRIEFAGIALSTDNELNGLTFGSVGSGTTIEHIQVSYSGDDSYEWFGGTVSPKYLIAYRGWDDDLDTDFGFTGKVQYAFVARDPNIADKSGSNGFESDNDGNGSTNTPQTQAVFANITVLGPFTFANLSGGNLSNSAVSANFQNGAHIRRNSGLKIYNSVIVGYGNAANWLVRFTDSKGGAAANAEVKNNYFARATSAKAKDPDSGTNDKGYDVTNFATDNVLESPLNKVDISSVLTGLSGAANIADPKAVAVPAAGSILLTGATDLSSIGLEKTDYKGAVTSSSNWLTESWINWDPINTAY
jgi:hypothetical protein